VIRTMSVINEQQIRSKFNKLVKFLISENITITTMESCTSGQVASLITDTEGASAIFKGAYITYSNEVKVDCGVPEEIIFQYGVYSPETALAMAQACRDKMKADIGIGITGSFGNADPNNADSRPGEVDVSIVYGDVHRTVHITLPRDLDRLNSKYYVAERIADELLQFAPEL